ncbi:uncharacterized protein LOC131893073 [Tigriopus californicus]|uniref:uncharacterized protein LOC131893073 n=1 Tax=Tigriopus californicus TaxID=6832 RepID=UPI0027DA5991|nr:uncharacterized protein LOC131893073 [Tigriopus californicus]
MKSSMVEFTLPMVFVWLSLICITSSDGRQAQVDRDGKLLSLFQIITFPNDPCIGNAGKNGTCYTPEECTAKGGSAAGTCAQGYGVCCSFTVNCGGTRSENCTYFESSGNEAGSCLATVCPCSDNICQLRLDFDQFVITGPSTDDTPVLTTLAGDTAAGGQASTLGGRCLTDTFSVSSPSGCAPPSICGTNSGEHMYVDASQACNDLMFVLGNQGIGASIANRQWSIKVTQYSCDFKNLAPEGCTQYFFGSSTDIIQTYNFGNGRHLADQNQNICIRRERGNCKICYTAIDPADVSVNGKTAKKGYNAKDTKCCGYTDSGKATNGFDCIVIPGLRTTGADSVLKGDSVCGNGVGLVTGMTGIVGATVCSKRQPFNVRFRSDSFETDTEMGILGFRLIYTQNSNGC